MENKVTNYELSKKLHDLGFGCKSYNGWWILNIKENKWFFSTYAIDMCFDFGISDSIKAYDCHDLLTWFSKVYVNVINPHCPLPKITIGLNKFCSMHEGRRSFIDVEPQNALAQSIITIFEEWKHFNITIDEIKKEREAKVKENDKHRKN